MGSPASRRATNLTLSSITEHSFHGIHFPPRKGRKCNLCVRYNLLPMSRVAPFLRLTQFSRFPQVSDPNIEFCVLVASSRVSRRRQLSHDKFARRHGAG